MIKALPVRGLPRKKSRGDFLFVGFGQLDISVLVCAAVTKGSGINKENLILPISQHYLLTLTLYLLALFVVTHDPEGNGDVRCVEHLSGQHDDGFNFLVLDQLLTDLIFFGISAQSAVGQKKRRSAVVGEPGQHVQNPSIVGIADGRNFVAIPPAIIFQFVFCAPVFQGFAKMKSARRFGCLSEEKVEASISPRSQFRPRMARFMRASL